MTVESATEQQVLGIIIDRQLTFNSNVQAIKKQIAKKVHQLSETKNFLDEFARKIF